MEKALLTILFTFFSIVSMAQEESRTEYNFLRLPVSAHAAALGGDNISIIEDEPSLIFSNPALLSSVSDMTIGLNYMNYMSGSSVAAASFNRTVKERASWAASAQYVDYGKIKQRDVNNIDLGEFSVREIAMAGYFAYLLNNNLSGGITAKYIMSYIGGYHSIGFGVDLGLNYYNSSNGWSFSAVAKNLGGQLKAYDDTFERMPIDVQLGLTKHFLNTPLRVSATFVDLNHLQYKFLHHIVLGIDFLPTEHIWVGGGYNFRRAAEMKIISGDKKSSSGAGWSFGAGVNLERFKINLAYGKYHVSASSILINLAYSL